MGARRLLYMRHRCHNLSDVLNTVCTVYLTCTIDSLGIQKTEYCKLVQYQKFERHNKVKSILLKIKVLEKDIEKKS